MYNWPKKNLNKLLVLGLAVTFVFGFSLVTSAEEDVPYGGWLDSIVTVEQEDEAAAITQLIDGEIDIFTETLTREDLLERTQEAPELEYVENFGSYQELTLNPAGTPDEPYFEGTGELNPFAHPEIREALNWLVDRNYIADELYGGMAEPKYTLSGTAFAEYARYIATQREIEVEYAHNPERASEQIQNAMMEMGAELDDGSWYYDGEPVEVTMLARVEDEREDVGDYVSALLEDEGFEVERMYATAAEASPIWMTGDPHAGEWSLYTGGWISTVVTRDEGPDFDFFFTERGLGTPLYMEYDPPEELDEIYDRLARRDFETMEERGELFREALWGSMENAKRIWLTDSLSFSPHREEVTLAADYAGGISGSWMWGHTVRFEDQVGGDLRVAMPSILTEPWNPPDGSNWIFDMMMIRATSEAGYMYDPYTGLQYPLHFEEAEVQIREGLPVEKTLDWVDLEFVEAEDNTVPEDAYYEWDAEEERFLTVGEVFDEAPTANRAVRTVYPDDVDTMWHDGTEFTVADILWMYILDMDRAQEESDIFDDAAVPAYESFMEDFLGFRIIDDDPITFEYYSDLYYLDAEMFIPSGFPQWDQGAGAMHNMAVAFEAEAEGLHAHSSSKADAEDIEHANYVGGPSLEYMEEQLEGMTEENYIPYENMLGDYITEEEMAERYENLNEWYEDKGHFWVDSGPYYLADAHAVEGIVELEPFEDYPYRADRWDIFDEPMIPDISVEDPGTVGVGEAVEIGVDVTFEGEPYPSEEVLSTDFLLFDTHENLVVTGELEEVAEGEWVVRLSEDDTAKLSTGPTRLEVIFSPLSIASPSIETVEFVVIEF